MIRSVRRRLTAAATAALLGFTPVVAGCSGDDDAPSGALDQVAPTKADLEREAGISFPPSMTGFRLVRISGEQLDVTFSITAADVDAFASGTGITLTPGKRTITHASPLWEVAIQGEFSGGTSTKDGVVRAAEVIPAGASATVRLTVQPAT